MKVTKHYESDHVMLYVEDGDIKTCITLDSDRQMRLLGNVLLICTEQVAGRLSSESKTEKEL